ncbi:MAG TPA: ABC transporter ATP-binding protein, partial [Kofleriaceae bacterium]
MRPAGPPPRGPFAMQMGGPPQKSKNFKGSARRLIAHFAPDRAAVYALIALGIAGAALTVTGPAIMRTVTNLIYGGWWSGKFPAGMTRDQAIAALRASGHDGQAELVAHLDYFKPGAGIDFATLGHVLVLVLAMYVAASLFTWLQLFVLNQVVQRRVRALREMVQAKMNRLPLAYFDQQPRGELLSRVTNDIDNLATGTQQTMSQMLNAALTAIGVLVMMVVLSRLLAVIALVTVPLSVLATARIGKRSQGRFAAQWKHVGALNAQVEEAFSGHALVNVFGRRTQVEATFAAKNQELYEMSFKAQFISSTIMPAINFIANLNYVAVAVVGGLRMASGAIDLGGVQQFMQYSRMFSQNLSQLAQVSNVLQSAVASAERVFEVLDAPEQSAEPTASPRAAEAQGEVRFDQVSFRYKPDQPLIDGLSLVARPGQTVAIVGPTGAGKTTLVNLIMRFYELSGGAITIDGV